MAKVKVTFTPPEALKQVRDLARHRVVIGVLGSDATEAHEDGGGSVANVATIHEYGAPDAGIPARSALRPVVKDPALKAFVTGEVRRVTAGKASAVEAYERVGLKAVSLVKSTIRAGIDPPLKRPRTRTKTQRKKDARLKKKGLPVPKKVETPLIDSGQLISSYTHEVRRK